MIFYLLYIIIWFIFLFLIMQDPFYNGEIPLLVLFITMAFWPIFILLLLLCFIINIFREMLYVFENFYNRRK